MFDDEKSVHILQKTCNQDKESCKHVGEIFQVGVCYLSSTLEDE